MCSFSGNAGLCGIPGLPTCGPHLSTSSKVGIAIGVFVSFLLILGCLIIWWKRRQNILRAQKLAGKTFVIAYGCLPLQGSFISKNNVAIFSFSFSFLFLNAAREAPYAKARTHFVRDVQMTRPQVHDHSRVAADNGPRLLS